MTALRVLYIDDEPTIRMFARISMEVGGFNVQECESGSEAIQLMKDGGFTPDLILLDFQMPGLNGEETLRELRQIPMTALTPVIIMSGEDRPEDREKFLAMGAAGVLDKSFDPFLLPDKILSILSV